MTKRTITLQEVRTAGRQAYNEKRLSAQGPTPMCAYRDDSGRPCIIGAAMTDEEAKRTSDGLPVQLFNAGDSRAGVAINPEERTELQDLQTLHDAWARSHDDLALAYSLLQNHSHPIHVPEDATPAFYEDLLVKALNQ